MMPEVREPTFVWFPSRRSAVHGTNGMVACSQPLAAEAGQRILKLGGNAAVRTREFPSEENPWRLSS